LNKRREGGGEERKKESILKKSQDIKVRPKRRKFK